MRSTILRIVAVLVAAFLVTACADSSIHMVKTWKSPEMTSGKFGKILVVGGSDFLERRLNFEDFFTGECKRQGVTAIQSYLVIRIGGALSRENLKNAARASGADGVLITKLESIRKEIKEVPGNLVPLYRPLTSYPYPDVDDGSSFPDTQYYVTYVREPPTEVTFLKVYMETRLFDAATSSMVWYGVATSGAVDDLKKATEALAREIIKALARDGMI